MLDQMRIHFTKSRVPGRAFPAFLLMLLSTLRIYGITADQIIQKAVEHGEHPFSGTNRPSFSYTKVSITDELDSSGKVRDQKKKMIVACSRIVPSGRRRRRGNVATASRGRIELKGLVSAITTPPNPGCGRCKRERSPR